MGCCCIRWCGKNSKKSNYKTDGITFHRFPQEAGIKEKWIACTKRENWFPSAYSVVCSRHFTEDCFYAMKNRRRLFGTAIPTMHLPVVSNTAVTYAHLNTKPSSSSQNEPLLTAPKATKRKTTYPETPPQIHSPTKKRLLLSSPENEPISNTPKAQPNATKRKATDPETSPQFHSPTKKRLLLSPSKHEPISTTPKATNSETPAQLQSPTKKRLPLASSKHELILTTPRATKRKATDPETPSQFHSPAKKRLCRRVLELSQKVKQKNKTIKDLRDKMRYYKKRVASLAFIIKELEKKSLLKAEDADILNKIGVLNKEIVQRQYQKHRTGKMVKKQYSPELRSFALTLNFYSTKAYKYVRKTFSTCLPSLRTLTKWYQTVDGRPGFTQEAFNALKAKAEASKEQLICTLVFDEIKIKSKIEYEPYSQRLFGYVDFGNQLETDCNSECTEALVFLVVPINGSFKVPIGYFLIDKTSGAQKANLVNNALTLCHENKITIKALTFDGCPANLAMAKELGCSLHKDKLKTDFKHPVTGANVFIYLDPVHMLKLVRNSFDKYQEFQDENGNSIKWDYIKLLQEIQEKENFHLANKLRAEHIHFKSNVMKVKLASQLFSRSVARALDFCKEELKLTKFEGVSATSKMIQLINDLFDILDSRVHGYGFKRALNMDNHNEMFERLEECKKFMLTVTAEIKIRNKIQQVKLIDSPRFTGFLGFCVAIESTKSMYKDLICDEKCPIKYLPMHKISQDHIELFFANIRSHGGSNDNPTPRLFEAIYKKCLIHTELVETSTGNCVPLEKISILNCSSAIARINLTTQSQADETINYDDQENQEDLDIRMEIVELSQFAENVIEYMAGYVSSALIKRIKCSTCIQALVSLSENKRSLIFYRDKGGLIYPSVCVIKICRRSEQFVKKYFIDGVNKRKYSSDFLVHKTISSYVGEILFPEYQYHQYYAEDTNHIIDLAQSVMKKYIDTRLAFLSKRKLYNEKQAVRRIYTKLIHFKNQ